MQSADFPGEIVEALRAHRKVEIPNLPVIELGERMGGTGYIDFLTLADMPPNADLAVFRDAYRRPGLALRIRSDDGTLDGVIAVFQRYTDDPSTWVYGLAEQANLDYHAICAAYNAIHEHDYRIPVACEKCPPFVLGAGYARDMAQQFIAKKDLCFRLANDHVEDDAKWKCVIV